MIHCALAPTPPSETPKEPIIIGFPSDAAARSNGVNSPTNDTLGATVAPCPHTTSTYCAPGYHCIAVPLAQLAAVGHHAHETLDAPCAANMLCARTHACLNFAGETTPPTSDAASIPAA